MLHSNTKALTHTSQVLHRQLPFASQSESAKLQATCSAVLAGTMMQQVAVDGLLPWGALLLLPPWTCLGRSRQGLPTEADTHLQLEWQFVQPQLADKHAATSSTVVKAATCLADASIGCKDDNRRQTAFQGSVQVCETLNVQHVHLVDEEHSRHQLSHALVNVSVHHLQPQTKLLLHHETERGQGRERERNITKLWPANKSNQVCSCLSENLTGMQDKHAPAKVMDDS